MAEIWVRGSLTIRLAGGKTRTDLTFWWFDNGHPTLFTDAILEQVKSKTCAVIDSNVFFDLADDQRAGHAESSSLLADWLSDSVEVCVTDEILNDINRSPSEEERRRSRGLVTQFTCLPCNNGILTTVTQALRQFFPGKNHPRDESDLWQIARTIASNAQLFVTRDQDLLDLSEKLYEGFGVNVLRPTDLIIRLDELRRENEYLPQRLAGTLSEVRLVQSGHETLLTDKFRALSLGESTSIFQDHLRRILASPDQTNCYLALDTLKEPIALFAYSHQRPDTLEIPLYV